MDPTSAGALQRYESAYNASLRFASQGHSQEALPHSLAAVEARPDFWEAHAHLGAVLLSLYRPEEALEHLEQAENLEPGRPEVSNNTGAALRALGRTDEAEAYFRRAVELNPRYADAVENLAGTLIGQARYEEAIAALQALVERGTQSAGILDALATAGAGLGNALLERGEIDRARAAFLEAIRQAPHRSQFYRYLAETDPAALTGEHLAMLEALTAQASSDAAACADAHFALGKVYAARGDARASFAHLLAANRLVRAGFFYDEAAELTAFRTSAGTFGANFLRIHAGSGDDSDLPIFIFGMPRSGTTLVEQILAAHPEVHAGGELPHFEQIAKEIISRGSGWNPAEIGRRYVSALRETAPEARRVTDKMPANFRYAGLIHLALPHARMIHVRRDPLDTCLSCFSTSFAAGALEWSYDLDELGRYHSAYRALMEHWCAALPPGAMLEVQYEDVVADSEGQVRRILAYCGLPWDERCLAFHTVRRPVKTASVVQVRTPLYRSSVRRAQLYGELLRPLEEALAQPFDLF